MQGGDFDRLGSGIDLLGISVVIPDIVKREFLKHVRKQAGEAYRRAKSVASEIEKLSGRDIRSGFGELEEHLDAALDTAEARLARFGVQVVPTPSVSIETILERDLEARKPFDHEGRGFRDTLIFLTLIGIAKSSDQRVVFVSKNSDDFAARGDKNQFHEQLLEEIQLEVNDPERIELIHTLSEFNEKHILPRLARVEGVQNALKSEEKWRQFELLHEVGEGLSAYLSRLTQRMKDERNIIIRPDQELDLVLGQLREVNTESVLELSESELLVIAMVTASIELLISDAWDESGQIDFASAAQAWIEGATGDKKKHFIRETSSGSRLFMTSAERIGAFRCLITIDSESGEVKSFDVGIVDLED